MLVKVPGCVCACLGFEQTGLGFCRRLNYSRNTVGAGQEHIKTAQLICKFSSLNISWKCHSSATETEHPLSFSHFLPKPERGRGKGTASAKLCLQPLPCPEILSSCQFSKLPYQPPGRVNLQLVILSHCPSVPLKDLGCCRWLSYRCSWYLLLLLGAVAPQHGQLCSTSVSLSVVCPAMLPVFCCMNNPKFHLKICSYIHSTSKAKAVAREASKLQIHYHLTDHQGATEEEQTSLSVGIPQSMERFLPAQPKGRSTSGLLFFLT